MISVYIVNGSDGKYRWISGIFNEEKDMLNYIDLMPEEIKKYQSITELKNIEYPFYIIEKENEFTYIEKNDELLKMIEEIELSHEENKVYFIIYTIQSDHSSNKPGTDYMGIIKHEHVTNDFIEWYRKKGEEFLIQNGLLVVLQ